MVRTVAEIETESRIRRGLSFAPQDRRVAVVADFLEEGWPSMDLAAELTSLAVAWQGGEAFIPAILRPQLPRLARRVRTLAAGTARNADRYVGRYFAYPRWLKRRAQRDFALFHVIDQSYAHLVHVLPKGRTVVTCHDLDAFASVSGSDPEPRPYWFRATMHWVMSGLAKAAHVVCDSAAVRDELVRRELVPAARLSVVPLPVHPDFSPEPREGADAEVRRLLGPRDPDAPDLLHVGANMPRKNLPLLLRLFAELRSRDPAARLVRVGGALDDEQRALAAELAIGDAILELPFLDRPVLAALYRHAAAVLLPSDREGYGWPVLEAMACGTPVVARDLPSLREIAGDAAVFVPTDDARAWAAMVEGVLAGRGEELREAALERARGFSLEAYGAALTAIYRRILHMPEPSA
ncbi:MAG TPA: glycosyltransferase family 1 protein [Longimicrobiaceae bacterium]|nr:glycosyltransferase family 1 protein [Longimicrobiaceae bacterium]